MLIAITMVIDPKDMVLKENLENHIIHMIDMMAPEEEEVDSKGKAMEKQTGVLIKSCTRRKVTQILNMLKRREKKLLSKKYSNIDTKKK